MHALWIPQLFGPTLMQQQLGKRSDKDDCCCQEMEAQPDDSTALMFPAELTRLAPGLLKPHQRSWSNASAAAVHRW